MEVFVNRVRLLRKQRGWSQDELSRASGVDRSTISQIENSVRDPKPATLRRLARTLGVNIGDLFDEEPDQYRLFDEREINRLARAASFVGDEESDNEREPARSFETARDFAQFLLQQLRDTQRENDALRQRLAELERRLAS
jgi:putative transcriptional regulator